MLRGWWFALLLMAFAVFVAACSQGGDLQAGCAGGDCSPTPSSTAGAAPVTAASVMPTAVTTPVIASTTCTPPVSSGPSSVGGVFCADPTAMQPASVVRIVDGDTLRAIVAGVEEPVRLFGVDTPERGQPCFEEASEVLRALVESAGGEIRLLPDARNRDSYDRLLRYVYTPAGLSIDAVLIAGGFGYAWTRDGALREPLMELEARARDEARGCLWR